MLEIDGKAHAQPITFCLDPHPLKLKDFPSWKPQVFVSCNKSIRTKQANPSTDTDLTLSWNSNRILNRPSNIREISQFVYD